ncbi:T9SS type A sorting domain-containing protein [bacterium]|nr:T9SS type A sorting domain-containing protein [bacterium]
MKYGIVLIVLFPLIIFALDEAPGWPKILPAPDATFSGSPLLIDLDCDDIKEVAIAGPDDSLRVFSINGTYFSGFPVALSGNVLTHIAIGPVTGTWFQFVFITDEGSVHVIERNGTEVSPFPVDLGSSPGPAGIALWDFDNDGFCEIVAHVDESLHVLGSDGANISGFPVSVESEFGPAASPAIGDLDGNGSAEIIVVGYNKLYAYEADGTILPLFPIELGDTSAFSYSSPVLVDLDNNDTLEICCGYHSFTGTNRGYIGAWNIEAGEIDSWPLLLGGYGSWIYGSLACGDLDGDRLPEIIATSHNGKGYVLNGDASSPDPWSMSLGIGALESSPLVCDFDNDGGPDILFLGNDTLGTITAFTAVGALIDSFPIEVGSPWKMATPSIDNMDSDINLEICALDSDGYLHLYKYPFSGTKYARPWIMGRHDPLRTGWHHPKPPANIEAYYHGDSVLVSWGKRETWDFFEYHLYSTADSVDSSGAFSLGEFSDTFAVVEFDSVFKYYFVTAATRFTESEKSVITDIDSLTGIIERNPSSFALKAYPNPFNSTCIIETDNPIRIFDINGKMVANLSTESNSSITWNATDNSGNELPSGIYHIKTINGSRSKRVVLIR